MRHCRDCTCPSSKTQRAGLHIVAGAQPGETRPTVGEQSTFRPGRGDMRAPNPPNDLNHGRRPFPERSEVKGPPGHPRDSCECSTCRSGHRIPAVMPNNAAPWFSCPTVVSVTLDPTDSAASLIAVASAAPTYLAEIGVQSRARDIVVSPLMGLSLRPCLPSPRLTPGARSCRPCRLPHSSRRDGRGTRLIHVPLDQIYAPNKGVGIM